MIALKDQVRFIETDMMGVVHHANYLRWFEMGRVEYLRQAGVYLLTLLDEKIMFPITTVNCFYHASAKFDDYIIIETALKELNKVKMVFSYRLVREEDNQVLATGATQNVFTDGKGTIIRLPDKYYHKIKELFLKETITD